jgi:Htaa
VDATAESGILKVLGDHRFSAHFGVLNVAILVPWIAYSPQSTLLSVATPGAALGCGSRIPLVSLQPDPPSVTDGVAMWLPLAARLTAEGAWTSNDVYPVDEPFDPVTIRITRIW